MSIATALALVSLLAAQNGATPLDNKDPKVVSTNHATLQIRFNHGPWHDVGRCKNALTCDHIGQKLVWGLIQPDKDFLWRYMPHAWYVDCPGKKFLGSVVCYHVKNDL